MYTRLAGQMQILAQKILPCSNHSQIKIVTPKLMPRYSHSVAAEIVSPCSCRDTLVPCGCRDRCSYPVAAKTIVPCGGPDIPTYLTFFADNTHCQNFSPALLAGCVHKSNSMSGCICDGFMFMKFGNIYAIMELPCCMTTSYPGYF